MGEYFLAGLKQLEAKYEIVKEARGRGMLLALELHPREEFSVTRAYHKLLDKGFLVGYYPAGNILRFSPALTISQDDIRTLLESLDQLLETVE